MDWFSSCRHVHVVPRYGQRVHNEDQHVGGHCSHGEPNGAGTGSDHSGRRVRGIVHSRRKHHVTREILFIPELYLSFLRHKLRECSQKLLRS